MCNVYDKIYKLLDFEPFDYQRKVIEDKSKRIIVCSGRQVGKSTMISIKAIIFALSHLNSLTLITSPSLRQSLLLLQKIKGYCKNIYPLIEKDLSQMIEFKNGSRIISLPSGDGSTLRGYSADLVIVDEANFIKSSVITSVLMPMISTTNGYLWLISTPYKFNHIFYQIWDKDDTFTKYHFTSYDNPLISKEFLDQQRKVMTNEEFEQEYLGKFVSEEQAIFSLSLLNRYTIPNLDKEPNILLLDIGGKKDQLGVVEVYEDKGNFTIVNSYGLNGDDYLVLLNNLLMKYPSIKKIIIDQTGIGQIAYDYLIHNYPNITIKGVVWDAKNKLEAVRSIYKALKEDKIAICEINTKLLEQLQSIKVSDNLIKKTNEKDDIAYALLLLYVELNSINIAYVDLF
ncbi:MAG: hypothetical protein KatS3mg003_1056 [Candidatus Nitrosocaldaceae archaeon]|nr:MAG: hypothetical protein KatS3mg003_1056 [Candidatus Nitrosocaldaceae archaeon]